MKIYLFQLLFIVIQLVEVYKAQEWCISLPNLPLSGFVGPGSYDPTLVSTDRTVCQNECYSQGLLFSAVYKLMYCFCTNDLSSSTNITLSTCVTSDGLYAITASSTDINVVLDMNTGAGAFGLSTSTIPLTPSVLQVNPVGSPIVFQYSYQDRNNIWENNIDTSVIKRIITSPGVYEIRAQSIKPFNKKMISQTSKQFLVFENLTNVNITCQPYGVVYIMAICTLNFTSGSRITGVITINGAWAENISFTDPPYERAGPVPNYFNIDFITGSSSSGIHLANAIFQYAGTVSYIELYAKNIATIDFLLFKPDCPTYYCYASSICSTDVLCSSQLTCNTSLCSISRSCASVCNKRLLKTESLTSLPVNYKIIQVFNYAITNVGYQVVNLTTPWSVDSGYRLGFHSSLVSDVIATTSTRATETVAFYYNSHSYGVATVINAALFSLNNVSHQLSAVAAPIRMYNLRFMFNTSAVYNIQVNLSSNLQNTITLNSTIDIGLNINDTNITTPYSALSNISKMFQLLPLTGSYLTYYWTFGDGTFSNTTIPTVNHSYSLHGSYNFSVVVYNAIVTRNNSYTISVKDPVVIYYFNGTTASNPNSIITFNISISGDGFNCTISGDSFTNVTKSVGNLNFTASWPLEGYYNIRMDCASDVSYAYKLWTQIILNNITGLQFSILGGVINQSTSVPFKWITGSNITWEFLFNNITTSLTTNDSSMTGSVGPLIVYNISNVIGVIRALNPKSEVILVANLTFDELIQGLQITSSNSYLKVNDSIVLNVSMIQGSSVFIIIDFNDGSPLTNYTGPYLSRWINNYTVPHSYNSTGTFNVTVRANNSANTVIASTPIYCIGILGNYSMNISQPFLKIGDILQVWITRIAGNPPVLGNMTVDWKDGKTDFVLFSQFNETAMYNHSYTATGVYNVTTSLINPLNSAINSKIITILNPIVNFRCSNFPLNTWKGGFIVFTGLIDSGDMVNVVFTPGDAGAPITKSLNVTALNTNVTFNYTYNTVGNYSGNITACNLLGCSYSTFFVQIQFKIVRTEFQITSNNFIEFNKDNSTIKLTFTGTNFPTLMNATFAFMDGSTPIVVPVSQSQMPYIQYKNISIVGYITVNVTLNNLANSETYTLGVGAWVKFQNFAMSMKWGPGRSNGFGATQTVFPLQQNIYFTPSTAGAGTVDYYMFSYVALNNITNIYTCNVTLINGEFPIMFNSLGTYNVTMMAINPIDKAYSSFNLTIGGSLKDTTIIPPLYTLYPNYYGFVTLTWSIISPDACICVSLGNGTKVIYGAISGCTNCTGYNYTKIKPMQNMIKITVRYPLEGDYLIAVNVYSTMDAAFVNRTIPITSIQCSMPVVSMKNVQYMSTDTPQIGFRGSQVMVTALIVDIPCIVTKNNIKVWSAELIDPLYYKTLSSISMASIPTFNNTQLIIPPLFFPYGLYKLTFTVTMDKNLTKFTFLNSSFTYLLVTKSPVTVALTSGGLTLIVKGVGQQITLNPMNYSKDPDLVTQNFTDWTWQWKCRNENENEALNVTVKPKPLGYAYPAPKTGCFGDGPGLVNFGSYANFWGENMDPNNNYIVDLTGISKDGRSGSTKLTLKIVAGVPANIAIQCLRPLLCTVKQDGPFAFGELAFNPSDSLLINATCMLPDGTLCTGGSWSILVQNGNTSKFTALTEDLSSYIKGMQSIQMSISPIFFTAKPTMQRFQACYTTSSTKVSGQACIQYFINQLPTGINCTLDKQKVSQTDTVCCNCTNGQTNNYRIFVNASGQLTTLGFSDNGYFCSIIPYQTIPQTYIVQVTNVNGGFVDYVVGNIQVQTLDNSELNKIMNQLLSGTDTTLQMVNAKGDLKTMAQVYLKYISVITVSNQNEMQDLFGSATNGSKTNFGGSGYTQANIVPGGKTLEDLSPTKRAKYENDRDSKSGLINQMTSYLVDMVPGDIQSLHLVSSVLSAITGSFDSLNRQGQDAISNKLLNLAVNLKTMQGTASKDDIEKISTSLLSATFQSDTAANSQITNGVKRDIKQSKDNFLDYDTNLESSKKSFIGVSDLGSAGDLLTLETNSDFQSSVSSKFGGNSEKTIQMVSKCLRDVAVVGDKPTALDSPQMQYFHQKTVAQDLNGQSINKGRSSIELPDICKALQVTDCSNQNNAISLEIIATPNNVKVAVPNANKDGLPIPLATDSVTVNLFAGTNDGEQKSSVKSSETFTITLSRDPSLAPPPFSSGFPNGTDPKIPDPQIIPGMGDLTTGLVYYKPQLIMHQFTLTGNDQSVHFEMKFPYEKKCTQFLIVARLFSSPALNALPDGTNDSVNAFTFWGMVPSNTKYCTIVPNDKEPNPFVFFISNVAYAAAKKDVLKTQPSYSTALNTLYFGVRELTKPEWNSYTSTNRPYPYNYYDQVNTSYTVRIYSSGCYSNSDNFKSSWATTGCEVGNLTTPSKTQCLCKHLTTFVSGFIVAPNTIDFNSVFSNFDLSKNPTLFITEGVIFIFFILLLIWARRKDIKDLEKIGVTPMVDNDPNDMYLYEIAVDTSIRNNAGTKSKVYFILSGETDETEARLIEDSKRLILQRGNIDRFLLAVPRTLGPLQYIRIWHDNSGKGANASWYCSYFGVIDLQTKEKFHFLVNSWFAVEEDDCQIDRLIAVASSEELLLFGELFARKMKADLTENHLWLSIMARPPESRFTRVERVACCLLLMFLTMLTTCMFYRGDGPSKVKTDALVIGPLAITPAEVWIGLVSGIIGFLPLFIVIDLFRKSQLKHGHANKLREAVEEHLQESIISDENKGATSSKANLINNDGNNIGRLETSAFGTPEQVNIEMSTSDLENNLNKKTEKKKVQKKLFPWWVRIISWIFLVIVLIVACFFTTMYGIQFGDSACKKWISSMFISFFASVILIQPVKVIVMAMIFTLLCKNSSAFDDDYVDEEDELMNELGQRNGLLLDERYMHEELYTSPMKPNRRQIHPPSKDDIEKARDHRLREMKMFDVIKEISFYIIFFTTLLLVTYSFRDPESFTLKTQFEKIFVTPSNPDWAFTGIRREDQFWDWALNVLVPGLRAPLWYNNNPQIYQRGFISDRTQRLMGYAVLRQVRVKKDSCTVYNYVKSLVKRCYGSYNLLTEDKTSYDVAWKTTNTTSEEFSYKSADTLNGLPYLGTMNAYSGGGYVYEFRSNVATLYSDISKLRDNHWLDFHTRAVFIEFTTYNPNINLFAICTFLLELPGSGGMWPSYRIEPANLLGVYGSGVTAFEICCQALYGIFIFLMIIKEIRNVMRQKWTYFKQFWNWLDMFLIVGSFACVAAFVYIRTATGKLTTKFSQTGGDAYMKFQDVAFWNEYMGYLTSFIVFAATLKFMKLLRFNRRIGMLGAVLKYCSRDMKQFFIIFLIMFSAFVMVFYALFMDSLDRYHTFLQSTESSMQIALGKFSFLELYQREPIFGPLVFALYVIFIIFVMLNMFIAILNEGFAVVRADIGLQSNEFEIVEFMMAKFIMFTGITNTKIGHKLIKTSMTDQLYKEIDERELTAKVNSFPDKVDQLLNHINHIVGSGLTEKSKKKDFSGVIFEDKFGPTTTICGSDQGGEDYQSSRPATARSIILETRYDRQMTPIGK